MSRSLRSWFSATGLILIAGCGSLLGLEDRSLDESPLGDGYAGCTPGGACDGCINQSHYDDCVAGSSGGAGGSSSSGGAGGSAGGVGGNSEVSNVSNVTDAGGTSGASNAGGNGGSAGAGGNAVATTSGGSGGEPFVCNPDAPVSDSCDACVCETCSTQLGDCAGDPGCIDIWNCFDTHACDPMPEVENSCFAPENCQDAIMNNGGLEGESLGRVQAMMGCAIEQCDCGNENCSLDNGCDCATCEEACECAGYSGDYCVATCNDGPVQCGSAGPGACLGCATCVSQCICGGGSELDCLSTCSLSTCSSQDCSNSCDNSVDTCVCSASSTTQACSEEQLGMSCSDYYASQVPAERLDCSVCGCENCPALNTRCEFDPFSVNGVPGCIALLECMDVTGCTGEACDQAGTCGDLLSQLDGIESYSMQIAEGLLACKNSQGCPSCGGPDDMGTTCGGDGCFGYEPGGGAPNAPACCAGQGGTLCGYSIGAYFPSPEGACFPANAPGGETATCPSAHVTTDTYSQDLPGCCMPMNGTCGLLESQIGLGCVPYDVVGQPMPNPAIACAP